MDDTGEGETEKIEGKSEDALEFGTLLDTHVTYVVELDDFRGPKQ